MTYISKGQLVPDAITIGMLRKKVEESHDVNGVIFDGFPRNVLQAEALDELLAEKDQLIGGLIALQVDDAEIVSRILERAQSGISGQEEWKVLELKVLADVGLVGFPNAGKSTLLSVLSAAKPKIGAYPFTTLKPNLGIVPYRGDRSFVMADIPGIIEGASEGKGLGLRFLRHIERNAVLLFMIPCDSDDPLNAYQTLEAELKAYNPELLDKPRVVAITKSDLIDKELKELIAEGLPDDWEVVFISSVAQLGIDELKDALWKALNPDGEDKSG
ncbi:UNVERIFIED_CONTAM: hypothetical protein GTU68_043606 [Idotea baltica]|nr:hypothetical protein [Idotea baltica]